MIYEKVCKKRRRSRRRFFAIRKKISWCGQNDPPTRAKVKDFILGLEISADIRRFRSNIDTGRLFISLRFFSKGTPNYVYIDLQRSPSKLTSCQCQVDLRSMSKASKLCQVVYHSTRIHGTKVFKLLRGYSGSKDNYHKENICSA